MLIDGPKSAPRTLVLAPGAGAPMDSPFMNQVAQSVAQLNVRVVRFEFPYMRLCREDSRRRPPDRETVLLAAWHAVITELGNVSRLAIGGKSLGGRIASMVADEMGVRGLVCLGYPFHPPGKPDHPRTAHLQHLSTPTLIVQGTRDPFGRREELIEYQLSQRIRFAWIEDGDHSFKPRVRSGRTEAQNLQEAASIVGDFMNELFN